MRRRHWVYLVAGSVGGAALTLSLSVFVNSPIGRRRSPCLRRRRRPRSSCQLLAAWLSSAHGKRLAVLFGVLAFPALLQLAEDTTGSRGTTVANVYVPGSDALVLCLVAVIIDRTRRRAGGGLAAPGSHQ